MTYEINLKFCKEHIENFNKNNKMDFWMLLSKADHGKVFYLMISWRPPKERKNITDFVNVVMLEDTHERFLCNVRLIIYHLSEIRMTYTPHLKVLEKKESNNQEIGQWSYFDDSSSP